MKRIEFREQDACHIHGTKVRLRGDPHLMARVSEYFRLLYEGDVPRGERPLKFELHPVEHPPSFPSEAVKVIRGPHASSCRSGKMILFVSGDGRSVISLDPVKREAQGYLNRQLSEDSEKFFSLLGSFVTEALKFLGLYFLHGACVCGNGKAYLFSGKSGSGKSTASFNLVRQGFQFVADDSLFFTEREGQIVVSPYYTKFHVDKKIVDLCPDMAGVGKLKDSRKGITRVRVNMREFYPDSFIPSLRPDYIIFPRIVHRGKSALSQLKQREVYRRLLKQTILAVDAQIARRQLLALEKLVKQVKGFEFISGKDMYEDPKMLPGLLAEIERESGNGKEMQS